MIGRKRVSYNGKRLVKKQKTSVPRPRKFLLGNKTSTTLKYFSNGQLNPGIAGIPATYVFSANGCYDPDITGTGHQPRGFDQLMALYDHYHVESSTIRVTFMNSNTGTSIVCGVALQDDSTPGANMIESMEQRYTSYAGMAVQESKTAKLKFSSKGFFDLNDRVLYGDSGSNPTEQAYFVIFAQPAYSVDPSALEYVVEIQYNVTFSEPNNVGAS